MHKRNHYFTRDLLLVGGGHAHVLALKMLSMRPMSGVRITLVSDHYQAPYSGMLPGFVAGHYSAEQTSIDLNSLCKRVGARWIQGRVIGIRPDDNCVEIEDQPDLFYDCLSIDTGAKPGFASSWRQASATSVKPIANFHRQWQNVQQVLSSKNDAQIGVVGAGVGGVEIGLALAYQLKQRDLNSTVHLVFRGPTILPGLPKRAITLVTGQLEKLGVQLHANFCVNDITDECLVSDDGARLPLDHSFVCTEVKAPEWLPNTKLALSSKGFIQVNNCLQSTSHANVFAAGDVADMDSVSRPKAGVFAVRQAPFLSENLQRFFRQQALKPVSLQNDFLKLISLGERQAIAVKHGLVLKGAWIWRWKNRIDRQFIDQFNDLEAMTPPPVNEEASMHCSGCGSKLGPELLQQNLQQLPAEDNGALSAAVHTIEDATVWRPTDNNDVAQSIDGFRSFTDDHYRFGKISVQHAINDLFAMGAVPVHAQAWVNLAFSHPRLQQRDHLRLMFGVNQALLANKAILGGGHSTEGVEDHLGVVVNGELTSNTSWQKRNTQAGDVLVLSKALGTGIILAADAQFDAPSASVEAAMVQMQNSNLPFFTALQSSVPNAVTDVSGFGLLGHLLEMLGDGNTSAELVLSSVPQIPGARQLAALGYRSSLRPSLDHYLSQCSFGKGADKVLLELLLDPQTSGGLLASIPAQFVDDLVESCSSSQSLYIIGRIVERKAGERPVQIL